MFEFELICKENLKSFLFVWILMLFLYFSYFVKQSKFNFEMDITSWTFGKEGAKVVWIGMDGMFLRVA